MGVNAGAGIPYGEDYGNRPPCARRQEIGPVGQERGKKGRR